MYSLRDVSLRGIAFWYCIAFQRICTVANIFLLKCIFINVTMFTIILGRLQM